MESSALLAALALFTLLIGMVITAVQLWMAERAKKKNGSGTRFAPKP